MWPIPKSDGLLVLARRSDLAPAAAGSKAYRLHVATRRMLTKPWLYRQHCTACQFFGEAVSFVRNHLSIRVKQSTFGIFSAIQTSDSSLLSMFLSG